MIYDAVLVARRGLGADELRLASPGFLDAVRWSLFVEKLADPLPELDAIAERVPDPTLLKGQDLIDAIAGRSRARDQAREIREILLLSEATDG